VRVHRVDVLTHEQAKLKNAAVALRFRRSWVRDC
jgi:hypothetical protein